jgi:pyruvate dehydrogenase E1 component
MSANMQQEDEKIQEIELKEWLDSLEYVLQSAGPERVKELIKALQDHAHSQGIKLPFSANTPYINSIHGEDQPNYPGSRELERRNKSIIRWNAMAMVVRANKLKDGIGGHISTYASAATLYEVGFNHFFRAPSENFNGDIVFYQGHASPGIYSRAFVEGRLSVEHLKNFRAETNPNGGLSSYPHPWLMPKFWQFATVSMGLGPIMSIYQARFNAYLEDRGLKPKNDEHVWAFLGDGETDEPETLGAISLAAREKLDNLTFVINCNLQRLDGPVRGNSSIINELERVFRGAGWNVIKVIWGSDWDPLLAADKNGLLVKRMGEVVDGEYQNYITKGGAYIRKHFWSKYPELLKLVEHLSDDQLERLSLGGHDPRKVYAAFDAAVKHKGSPTVILARTVKGYGLGEAGEGKNITHSQKKLNDEELREFRTRFGIPVSDEEIDKVPFYKPADDSAEMKYLHERRKQLGGYVPIRREKSDVLKAPDEKLFEEFYEGTGDRKASTTMVFVRMLSKLLRDKDIGKLIVPIVPDEARTFGMESLFRQVGIYAHEGQLYDPMDKESLLYYKEAQDGQILEEGITESGSMSSFIATGTAYSIHNINTIPFFIFYSMFGIQRIGDLAWAAGDMRVKGFMLGATSGRTTLAGEGLQHQDGNTLLSVYTYPSIKAYDPAFAYELAVIIHYGIYDMYEAQNNGYYYITVMNENYIQPQMPKGKEIKDGIIKGMYKFRSSSKKNAKLHINLMGSGTIMNCVIRAADTLEKKYNAAVDIYSVTSYKALYVEANDAERWNMLNPDKKARIPYISDLLKNVKDPFVAASDYVKALPESISQWLPGPLTALGTDGYGRSDGREELRDFFEVDERYIVLAALYQFHKLGKIKIDIIKKAIKEMKLDPNKKNPYFS